MIAPNTKRFVSVARRRWCDRGFVGGVRVDRSRRIGVVRCVGVRGGFAAAPVARHGGFQDVVDGDYPEELVVVVDDGQVEQVVIGHQQRYVDQVGVGVHADGIGVGDVPQRGARVGLEQGDQAGSTTQPPVFVLWGSESRPTPLDLVICVFSSRGMIVRCGVASVLSDLPASAESVDVAGPLVGV